MFLIERHGEIRTYPFQLPFLDFAGVAVNDSNLILRCQIDKDSRTGLFKLERLGMRPEFKVLAGVFIGSRINCSNGSVAVANVD